MELFSAGLVSLVTAVLGYSASDTFFATGSRELLVSDPPVTGYSLNVPFVPAPTDAYPDDSDPLLFYVSFFVST